jgi:hypothetical protein
MNSINEKLVKEDAIITKTDKGKTCVVMYTKDYNNKVQDFLTNNNFQNILKGPNTNINSKSPNPYKTVTSSYRKPN